MLNKISLPITCFYGILTILFTKRLSEFSVFDSIFNLFDYAHFHVSKLLYFFLGFSPKGEG